MAEKETELENTGTHLSELAEVYRDSPELREVLSDTKVTRELKQNVLKKILDRILLFNYYFYACNTSDFLFYILNKSLWLPVLYRSDLDF